MLVNHMGIKGVDDRQLPDPSLPDATLETCKRLNYCTLIFLPRYKMINQLYFEAGLHGSFLGSAKKYYRVKPNNNNGVQYKAGIPIGVGMKGVQQKHDK
jgi:hypothetical protein